MSIKHKKLYVAIAGAVIGAALLLLGGRVTDDKSNGNGTAATPSVEQAQTAVMDAYRETLERRMENICSQVRGAGEVDVIVSLSGGFEYVYASNAKWSGNSTVTEYIVVDSGSDEKLVLLHEKVPEITGIGVVCAGGADPEVRGEVTQLLSAAFGVGSHKIHVTCGK
jgi:stage III sporulation protein AG